MRNKLSLETLSHIIALTSIILVFYIHAKTDREIKRITKGNEKACSIMQSFDIEAKSLGADLSDGIVSTLNGEITPITNLIAEDKLNIFIYVSFEDCNACRDAELKRWGQYAKVNPNVKIELIAKKPSNPSMAREQQIEGKALSGILAYFDENHSIENLLHVTKDETPLILAVTAYATVAAAYKGDINTQERSDHFLQLLDFANQR
jgi:hypothetical protein